MPAAAPAVVAAIIASSYSGWVAAGIMVAGAALSTGIGYLQQRKAMQNMRELDTEGIHANTRSAQAELRSYFGLNRVGGNDVFMDSAGPDRKKLWIVQTLSDGRCNGIRTVGGLPQVWLGDKLWNEYGHSGELVKIHFHDGSSNQTVDPALAAAIPRWTDCMRNTCYIVYEIDYDSNWFQSLPQRTVELEGRYIWDFRTSEWVYSSNAALVLYCYMTDESFPLEYPESYFDLDTWTAAADYCDLKGYAWQGAITPDMSPMDVINSITANFRGKLTYSAGKFGLKVLDLNYEAAVMTLTDEHILRDESGRAMITVTQPGRYSRPDALKVRFINPDKEYTEDHVIVGDETGVIKDYALPGCHSRDMAASLGVYELERQRLDRTISLTARGDAMRLEPADVVVIDLPDLGISGYLMRVIETEILPDQLVNLALAFEAESLYNDVYDLRTDEIYTCSLPDPGAEPPGVGNVTVTEEAYTYRLRTEVRLKVAFEKPTDFPWFSHIEVWQSFDDITWTYRFPVEGDFEIGPVEEGKTYYLRLKVVSIFDRRQADENDYKIQHLVAGIAAIPPASLERLDVIVSGTAVNLWAVKLPYADIELYEYRLGLTWNGAIFLASMLSPNLSLQGVKPGTHTFLCNVKGTNGLYAATPRSQTVALVDPPDGWSVQATSTLDYTTGNHANTEHVMYSGEDHLKCSHIMWDLLDDPCASLAGWTDVDDGDAATTQVEFDGCDCFRLDSGPNSAANDDYAGIDRNVGSLGSATTIELSLYCEAIGDRENTDHFFFGIADGATYAAFHISSTGFFANDGTGYVEVGEDLVQQGAWQKWRIVIDWAAQTADVYLDDVLQASGVSVANEAAVSEGTVRVRQYGYGTNNRVSYVDSLRIGNGAYAPGKSALTGTWTSPVIDRGSSARRLVYALADIVITGAGTTWGDLVPPPATWRDLNVLRTWRKIFELPAGPSLRMSLLYGDTNPPTNVIGRLEILYAVVTGRYFQIQVEITDPSDAVFTLLEKLSLKFCQPA